MDKALVEHVTKAINEERSNNGYCGENIAEAAIRAVNSYKHLEAEWIEIKEGAPCPGQCPEYEGCSDANGKRYYRRCWLEYLPI